MEPISHIAVFYLIFKNLNIKKLWTGMITSILPDSLLIISWIGIIFGLGFAFKSSNPINLFLHSIFPLIILIPIVFFSKKYYYSSTLGYSLHLLLDYLTHSAIRMPFYPISTWKLPIFVTSYMNPIFSISVFIIILLGFLITDNKKLRHLFIDLFTNYNKQKILLVISFYILIILIFSVWYSYYFLHIRFPLWILGSILIGINIFLLGFIFIIEISYDEKTAKYLYRFKKFLREKK
jgi:hypothetical protein